MAFTIVVNNTSRTSLTSTTSSSSQLAEHIFLCPYTSALVTLRTAQTTVTRGVRCIANYFWYTQRIARLSKLILHPTHTLSLSISQTRNFRYPAHVDSVAPKSTRNPVKLSSAHLLTFTLVQYAQSIAEPHPLDPATWNPSMICNPDTCILCYFHNQS